MTGIGRLELAAFDAPDIRMLADFSVALTGWEAVRDVGGWITLRVDDGQEVAFQLARELVRIQRSTTDVKRRPGNHLSTRPPRGTK